MGVLWDQIVKVFQTYKGGSLDVTRRVLSLGARDGVTGWCAKSFAESTIKMCIIPKGASTLALACGTYVRLDAIGLTDSAFQEGDEVKTVRNIYYEVKTIREHGVTPDIIEYYECDLVKLPLYV
jgi:hypothetical protein